MIDFTPSPVAFHLGPVAVAWYGIGYAVGLAATGWLVGREARRLRLDADVLWNGFVLVAIAALVGGRLYHVIDQFDRYRDNLINIILPPYSGLGVYGGIFLGTVAGVLYARRLRQPVWRWADAIAPGLFLMQAIARWGNFFNQELYGPPTTLPWAIRIECQNRIPAYPCDLFPFETTHFHPLFLYESLSGVIGMLALLWIGRRFADRLRAGDLFLGFLIWYSVVRFGLEALRTDNWTFFGIPVAQIVSAGTILVAVTILAYRHRPGVVREPWPPADTEDEWDDEGVWDDEGADRDVSSIGRDAGRGPMSERSGGGRGSTASSSPPS
ncbi:MAG TPA: prolipoprotein diacylglyceryl transferase [Candidatus Limnocylindrales bacterium]